MVGKHVHGHAIDYFDVVPSPVLALSNMNDQPVNLSNYLHHDMVCLVAFLQTKFK